LPENLRKKKRREIIRQEISVKKALGGEGQGGIDRNRTNETSKGRKKKGRLRRKTTPTSQHTQEKKKKKRLAQKGIPQTEWGGRGGKNPPSRPEKPGLPWTEGLGKNRWASPERWTSPDQRALRKWNDHIKRKNAPVPPLGKRRVVKKNRT